MQLFDPSHTCSKPKGGKTCKTSVNFDDPAHAAVNRAHPSRNTRCNKQSSKFTPKLIESLQLTGLLVTIRSICQSCIRSQRRELSQHRRISVETAAQSESYDHSNSVFCSRKWECDRKNVALKYWKPSLISSIC